MHETPPNGSLPQNRNLLGVARGLDARSELVSKLVVGRDFEGPFMLGFGVRLTSTSVDTVLLSISWTVLVGLFCVPYIL